MEQIAAASADFNMAVVDVAASPGVRLPIGVGDSDLSAIRNTEQLVITAVDKPDPSCCFFQVLIEPVPIIAIAVQVLFALVRVQTQEVCVFLRINTDTVIVLLCLHLALRGTVAVVCKSLAVVKDVPFLTQ